MSTIGIRDGQVAGAVAFGGVLEIGNTVQQPDEAEQDERRAFYHAFEIGAQLAPQLAEGGANASARRDAMQFAELMEREWP